MSKNPINGNQRKLVIILSIILSVLLIVFFLYMTSSKIDTDKFIETLNETNYENAYKMYSKSIVDYHQTYETYLKKLINDYNNSVTTYENTIDKINSLVEYGFSNDSTASCKMQIESLFVSKGIYIQASEHFINHNLEEAINLYLQVAEEDVNYTDAQNYVAEANELLLENENRYIEADTLYTDNKLDEAYIIYTTIVDSKINIDSAAVKITKIEDIMSAWDLEFPGNEYTKRTFPNQIVSKENYIYLPYSYKGTHSILRYNTDNGNTDIFPIARFPGILLIKDINIVGEYLYFIAGENVGIGKYLDNPYNIYRMKNNGSDLQLVAKGSYTKLIAYKDGFYASSNTDGIIKLDRNLKLIDQLSEEPALMMQLFDDKLYYTIDSHDPYKTWYNEYSYDGSETVLVRGQSHLRFQTYENYDIFYRRIGNDYTERILYYDYESGRLITLKDRENFIGIYGVLNNKLICAKERINGELRYHTIDLDTLELTQYIQRMPEGIGPFEGLCYENETIFFSSDNGFIITDKEYNYISTIDLSQIDINDLSLNNQVNFLHDDSEYYSSEEEIIIEDGLWLYRSPEYNIRIEEHYNEDFDTNIYIAHIRTKDTDAFNVDNASVNEEGVRERKFPLNLARQHSAVFACSGDFYDTNLWPGIVIRDGVVYRNIIERDMMAIYPDGSFVCYTNEDEITAQELLDSGVQDTLSFGPILISDEKYGTELTSHFLCRQNPRNSIGMIEPGHYVFIVSEGRMPESSGLTLRSLAELFKQEGCPVAYNLDGGQSVAMMFMGEYVNTHDGDVFSGYFRTLPEVIYFGTSDLVPDEIILKR